MFVENALTHDVNELSLLHRTAGAMVSHARLSISVYDCRGMGGGDVVDCVRIYPRDLADGDGNWAEQPAIAGSQ